MARAALQGAVSSWQAVGPAQVNTSTFGLVTGRITSIAADPADATGNTVYLGTTGGGVWKSTNAAAAPSSVVFTPLTDDVSAFSSAPLTSISIGAVTVQPGGTGVILAGTGDPNGATDSWYGAGILRSTDGGNTWTLIRRTLQAPNGFFYNFNGNAFASFAWSTSNPDLVIAAVSTSTYGQLLNATNNLGILGLYYSLDSGASWQLATIEDGSTILQSSQTAAGSGNAATAVIWNPVRQRFYAAIRHHGYYESSDGITWSRLAQQPGANLTLSLCPTNAATAASSACPIYRGALAVQPVTGDIFALTVDQYDRDQGLWQDACNASGGRCASGTVQFATRITDTAFDSTFGDGTIPEGTYNLSLAAVPSQQDTLLFAGATDIWRCSLANSCSWRNTTNAATCASAQVAPAQHAVDSTFGSTGLLYFGNDGGLWRTQDGVNQTAQPCSSDDATHFQNLNGSIGSLAEVESFSQDPGNASTLLAALGAFGTAAPAASGSAWNQVLNGEGNFVAIDPANTQNWYATSEFGIGLNTCTQGTACDITGFGSVAIGEAQVSNDVQTIPAPWILDPQDSSSLILGTCRVWRGPAGGAGWSTSNLLSNSLDGDIAPACNGNAEIRSIAAGVNSTGTSAAERLYVGMAGAMDGGGLVAGHLYTAAVDSTSTASTTTWTDVGLSPVTNSTVLHFNPAGADVSSLYVDPHDPTAQTIYATIQGYQDRVTNAPSIYRSTDAGAHWASVASNLPSAPANSVVVDPNDANVVYVALDTGVYYTNDILSCTLDQHACWNVLGTDLPTAPVTSLATFNSGATQLLRAATYGRGIWQIGLVTAATAQTTATFTPDPLNFPDQAVQTASLPQTLTLTNTGAVTLNVASIAITGDFTETDNCAGQSVAPQSSCTISVTFIPSQTGARTGSLTVYANLASGQIAATLTGNGLAPASVALLPITLTFPATTVGSTSSAQIVTVNNNGGQSAAIQSKGVTGDFLISGDTCGNSLAAQTSCSVSIAFHPTASGTRTGALTVIDSVGAQSVPLTGTGETAATDTLSPRSLSFGSQTTGTTSAPQQITVTNSGDQDLTRIAVSASTGFTVSNQCGATLQGHAACALLVSFAPIAVGSISGTLNFTDQFGTQTIPLTGTGLLPPGVSASPVAVSFGAIAVGSTSSVQSVTVTNNGGSALQNLASAVTGAFAIATNNCPSTLPVGASCQVGITFSPASAGNASGTLTVSASNLTRNVSVPLSGSGQDFSIAVTGSSSALVTSGQTASFVLQVAGISGSSGTAAISCTGAPKNATCTANPTSVAFSGANTSTVTVTIATGVQTTASAHWKTAFPLLALFAPVLWLGARRRTLAGLGVMLLAVALLIPSGCSVTASAGAPGSGSGSGSGGSGGGSGSAYATPPGTYTLTVTGSMGNIAHSTTLNLTVQ